MAAHHCRRNGGWRPPFPVPAPGAACRRSAAVAYGVATTIPVFITRAGGGVLIDVDGNSLIDFGSGIAIVSVGSAADRVVANMSAARSQRLNGPPSSRRTLGTGGCVSRPGRFTIAR
jgi:hypothetical protein